jgi:glycine/D-amino acid oxidase-like deaminating enzyme
VRSVAVGLGAMGVATARVAAERGHAVTAFDRFGVANRLGFSAHTSGIFRLAYDRVGYLRLARRVAALA